MLSSNQRTALVTGGAKRLGRAIAEELAAAGYGIIIHYRGSSRSAASLAAKLERNGSRAWTVQADLADPAAGEALMHRAMELAGQVDVLVNSASVFPEGKLADISFADLEKNVAVNAWSPLALCRTFAQQADNGTVVNLLDTRIRGYDRNHAAYYLSKKMLETLTAACALEFAPQVRVNAVAPGLILPPPGKTKAYLEKLKHTNPLNTYGNAADIAGAVRFLVESQFITGQIVYVDGGRHLHGVMRG